MRLSMSLSLLTAVFLTELTREVCYAFLFSKTPPALSAYKWSAQQKTTSEVERLEALHMVNYNTFVSASSTYVAPCSLEVDSGNSALSLSDYMRLPVDQYVCIQMPLDASLQRVAGEDFTLTIPPVTFFNLALSPTMYCHVTQTDNMVRISSMKVILGGSPYIASLNGCFRMNITSSFTWTDTPAEKSIFSESEIYLEVDPPAPFKYFGKSVLESAGTLAMKIALRNIENAFVRSLARDYDRWVVDARYRADRESCILTDSALDIEEKLLTDTVEDAIVLSGSFGEIMKTKMDKLAKPMTETDTMDDSLSCDLYYEGDASKVDQLIEQDTSPSVLTDDVCLLPGEPQVRIEEAPINSRRIFTGIDIFSDIDSVWNTLTAYETLQDVVPSIVSNRVLFRTSNGGARLDQVGGAKVLPGVTFKAKTVLDVVPYDEQHPIPPNMLMEQLPVNTPDSKEREFYSKLLLQRGVFPRPYAYTSLPHRDLTMQNVLGEGDFLHYQGVWRMQELPNCAPPGKKATRLTYAVEIQPKGFLPVSLIEARIASDLKTNLQAIKSFVESLPTPVAVVDLKKTPSLASLSSAGRSGKSLTKSPLQNNDSIASTSTSIDRTGSSSISSSSSSSSSISISISPPPPTTTATTTTTSTSTSTSTSTTGLSSSSSNVDDALRETQPLHVVVERQGDVSTESTKPAPFYQGFITSIASVFQWKLFDEEGTVESVRSRSSEVTVTSVPVADDRSRRLLEEKQVQEQVTLDPRTLVRRSSDSSEDEVEEEGAVVVEEVTAEVAQLIVALKKSNAELERRVAELEKKVAIITIQDLYKPKS